MYLEIYVNIFVDFSTFLVLDSQFHFLIAGKYTVRYLIMLSILRPFLWPRIWSILENVSCGIERISTVMHRLMTGICSKK